MPYNLIHERWIPVRFDDGSRDDIAPWEIVLAEREGQEKIPVALSAPRPDFNGALIQFLIGLVQTAFAPKTEREWRIRFRRPPKPDELKTAFVRYDSAFNLDGDGPRFMQDLEKLDGDPLPIPNLLIDTPTGKTLEDNKDHFNKDRST